MIGHSRFTATLSMLTRLITPLACGQSAPVKNVVLVHCASSFDADVTATRRVPDMHSGRSILVSHSQGGSVIPEAGNDGHVTALVYVAARSRHTAMRCSMLALDSSDVRDRRGAI